MLIREVEKLTGIKDVNIRYYEKEGLIHPERKSNGYREYSTTDVELIRQIKVLRLLDVPVSEIKKIFSSELTLQEVMQQRLTEISDEELRLKEIRSSCENILNENVGISNLSEDLLCGSTTTWKERLEQIIKQDIDKKFLGKSTIYMIIWAIFAKLAVTGMTAHSLGIFDSTANGDIIGINFYVLVAIGMFLALYGVGLTIFEALTGKGFLWVWGSNWSGGGLGGLANSFTFLGLGVGIMGISAGAFITLLVIACVISATIRGYLMYRNKKVAEHESRWKNGTIVAICSLVLLLIYIGFLAFLYNDSKTNPVIQSEIAAENQKRNNIDAAVASGQVDAIEITDDNWEDYFEHKEKTVYEKDKDDKVTSVYLDSWFELKDEYMEKLDDSISSGVTFSIYAKKICKSYKITDAKTGKYELTGTVNGLINSIYKINTYSIIWTYPNEESLSTYGKENYVSVGLEHSDKSSNNPYMEICEKFEVRNVSGTIYLKK